MPGARGWGRRPSGIPRLNPGSPLMNSLIASWANAGQSGLVSVGFPSLSVALAGTPSVGASPSCGTGTVFDGSSVEGQVTVPRSNSQNEVTVAAWVSFPSGGAQTQYGRIIEKGANTNWLLNVNEDGSGASKVSWQFKLGGVSVALTTTSDYAASGAHLFVGRAIAGSGAMSLVVDGGRESLSGTAGASSPFNTDNIHLGAYGGGGFRAKMTLFAVSVWARSLSDREVYALYDPRTRWDLYWVPSRRVYGFVSTPPPGGFLSRLTLLRAG